MSVDFRTRNHLSLIKVETTPGTDAGPTPGANAVRTNGVPVWSPNLERLDTNFAQESVSAGAPVMGGGAGSVRGSSWMSGAGTAGIAPDYGAVLQSAAMQETLTAADVANTSQAVAAGTVTLDAGASAVDDIYKGMVISGTSGFFNGQDRVITAYDGTTKIASVYPNFTGTPAGTPTFAIRANARYVPISQGQKLVTFYGYRHGLASGSNSKLRKLLGAASSLQIQLQTARMAQLDWTMSGQFPAAPTDVSKPSSATYIGAAPEAFKNASCYLGGAAVKMNSFNFDFGNNVAMFDDPAQAFGKDTADIPSRTMTGRLQLAESYASTRDAITDMINATSRPLWLYWGSAFGKRVSIYIPAAQYTGKEETDVSGFAAEGLPLQALGSDSEIFIAVL